MAPVVKNPVERTREIRVSEQQPSRPVEKEHGGKRADHFVQQVTSGRGQEPEHGAKANAFQTRM
jgi:hypothetical protein